MPVICRPGARLQDKAVLVSVPENKSHLRPNPELNGAPPAQEPNAPNQVAEHSDTLPAPHHGGVAAALPQWEPRARLWTGEEPSRIR